MLESTESPSQPPELASGQDLEGLHTLSNSLQHLNSPSTGVAPRQPEESLQLTETEATTLREAIRSVATLERNKCFDLLVEYAAFKVIEAPDRQTILSEISIRCQKIFTDEGITDPKAQARTHAQFLAATVLRWTERSIPCADIAIAYTDPRFTEKLLAQSKIIIDRAFEGGGSSPECFPAKPDRNECNSLAGSNLTSLASTLFKGSLPKDAEDGIAVTLPDSFFSGYAGCEIFVGYCETPGIIIKPSNPMDPSPPVYIVPQATKYVIEAALSEVTIADETFLLGENLRGSDLKNLTLNGPREVMIVGLINGSQALSIGSEDSCGNLTTTVLSRIGAGLHRFVAHTHPAKSNSLNIDGQQYIPEMFWIPSGADISHACSKPNLIFSPHGVTAYAPHAVLPIASGFTSPELGCPALWSTVLEIQKFLLAHSTANLYKHQNPPTRETAIELLNQFGVSVCFIPWSEIEQDSLEAIVEKTSQAMEHAQSPIPFQEVIGHLKQVAIEWAETIDAPAALESAKAILGSLRGKIHEIANRPATSQLSQEVVREIIALEYAFASHQSTFLNTQLILPTRNPNGPNSLGPLAEVLFDAWGHLAYATWGAATMKVTGDTSRPEVIQGRASIHKLEELCFTQEGMISRHYLDGLHARLYPRS